MSAGSYGPIPGLNNIPLGGISIAGAGQTSHAGHDELIQGSQGLNIRIVPASGGHIVSIRRDHNYGTNSDLHIINEDKDLGAELGKIITLHYLKT